MYIRIYVVILGASAALVAHDHLLLAFYGRLFASIAAATSIRSLGLGMLSYVNQRASLGHVLKHRFACQCGFAAAVSYATCFMSRDNHTRTCSVPRVVGPCHERTSFVASACVRFRCASHSPCRASFCFSSLFAQGVPHLGSRPGEHLACLSGSRDAGRQESGIMPTRQADIGVQVEIACRRAPTMFCFVICGVACFTLASPHRDMWAELANVDLSLSCGRPQGVALTLLCIAARGRRRKCWSPQSSPR